MKKPTLVSLFTGAGGLDIGLGQAGFETVFASEIEYYACETLRTNRILRSLEPREFGRWFKEQISHQRCYANASHAEVVSLRRRLRSAFNDNENYFGNAHIVQKDVRSLSTGEVLEAIKAKSGDVDLIAGGAPCQPFSRAGKREVVESDTGQLFLEFVRHVHALRPRWFLFENVKGLVLHKADVASYRCPRCKNVDIAEFTMRDDFRAASKFNTTCEACGFNGTHTVVWDKRKAGSLEIIEREFERAGYKCRSVILDAADFGAPQHRERLFIVGSRDNEKLEWPEPMFCEPLATRRSPDLFEMMDGMKLPWRTVNQVLYQEDHWRYGKLDPSTAVLWVKNVVRPHDEPVTWTLDRPGPTVGAHQAAKLAIAPFGVPGEQLERQQWHILGRRQGDTPPVFVEHEYLTDDELLALQTFPRSWYLYGTRMQRAFQIGNAVPPVLAKVVGEAILKAMGYVTSPLPIESERMNEKLYA